MKIHYKYKVILRIQPGCTSAHDVRFIGETTSYAGERINTVLSSRKKESIVLTFLLLQLVSSGILSRYVYDNKVT